MCRRRATSMAIYGDQCRTNLPAVRPQQQPTVFAQNGFREGRLQAQRACQEARQQACNGWEPELLWVQEGLNTSATCMVQDAHLPGRLHAAHRSTGSPQQTALPVPPAGQHTTALAAAAPKPAARAPRLHRCPARLLQLGRAGRCRRPAGGRFLQAAPAGAAASAAAAVDGCHPCGSRPALPSLPQRPASRAAAMVCWTPAGRPPGRHPECRRLGLQWMPHSRPAATPASHQGGCGRTQCHSGMHAIGAAAHEGNESSSSSLLTSSATVSTRLQPRSAAAAGWTRSALTPHSSMAPDRREGRASAPLQSTAPTTAGSRHSTSPMSSSSR